MRKLKLAMYVSLDGVVENPSWIFPFWNEQLSNLQSDYLFASDALVLGRVTYEGFAAAWPTMEESTGEFGKRMNAMPKFVASRTLDKAEWNATLIEGELVSEVRRLKERPGTDLLIYGSGDVVDQLTREGLIVDDASARRCDDNRHGRRRPHVSEAHLTYSYIGIYRACCGTGGDNRRCVQRGGRAAAASDPRRAGRR